MYLRYIAMDLRGTTLPRVDYNARTPDEKKGAWSRVRVITFIPEWAEPENNQINDLTKV